MPILQYHYRPRRLAATLLALLLASFAVPAAAEITAEVNGVADDVRNNILAYLSFDRYKESESLTPEIVENLRRLGAHYFITTRWGELEEVHPETVAHLERFPEASVDGAPGVRVLKLR